MSFFLSPIFWLLEGLLLALAVAGLRAWLIDRGTPMTFWKWLLVGLWILTACFASAFVGTSLGEGEPTAALRGGIIFGVTTIIMGVAFWRIIRGPRLPTVKAPRPPNAGSSTEDA